MGDIKSYKQTVKEAADSLIESDLEGTIVLEDLPDLVALIRLAYPEYNPSIPVAHQNISVYGVEVTFYDGDIRNFVRIGLDRAQAETKYYLETDGVDTVTIKMPDTSQESHVV